MKLATKYTLAAVAALTALGLGTGIASACPTPTQPVHTVSHQPQPPKVTVTPPKHVQPTPVQTEPSKPPVHTQQPTPPVNTEKPKPPQCKAGVEVLNDKGDACIPCKQPPVVVKTTPVVPPKKPVVPTAPSSWVPPIVFLPPASMTAPPASPATPATIEIAPPLTITKVTPVATTTPLANTGSNTSKLMGIGVALVLCGFSMLLISRHRRTS